MNDVRSFLYRLHIDGGHIGFLYSTYSKVFGDAADILDLPPVYSTAEGSELNDFDQR